MRDPVLPASAEGGQQEPKIKPMRQHFDSCVPFPASTSRCGEHFVQLETKDREQIHDSSAILNLRDSRSDCSKTDRNLNFTLIGWPHCAARKRPGGLRSCIARG